MSITSLQPPPPDPSNRVADDPRAAALGEALFFETGFSADGSVACATCHRPERQFQDDLPRGKGIGTAGRRTMPLAGAAYHPFFFWDGRKDSLWSQALGPIESASEHGSDRVAVARVVAENYRHEFEDVFGSFPDLGDLPDHASPAGGPEAVALWDGLDAAQQRSVNVVFSNLGKALEAFERTIPVPGTRFDAYAAALAAGDEAAAGQIFTDVERRGLRLFVHEAECVRCHGGPLLTDMQFHNIGLPDNTEEADAGRVTAAHKVMDDPFNCLGEFSDAGKPERCFETYTLRPDLPSQKGAFKSPSLRGVAQRPPYMHTGQFATLRDVLVHYNDAPKATYGASELRQPLKLTDAQIGELEAFLHTLDVALAP